MIALNLIPPLEKKEISLRQFYIVIKNLTIVFLLFTVTIAIILLVAKAILQNSFNNLVSDYTLTTKYGKISNREMEKFNSQLSAVSEIQKNYIPWTNFIAQLVEKIPDNIIIYSIGLNADGQSIKIAGFAQSRQDLLQFENNLKNYEIIDKVDVPLESLLNKENINFDISAEIDTNKIKNL
ncbi:MAG: PilN domain-containing protein [Patescibacteria group bacterium]|jgi:Tfp pilus assembly protein PilN|nr:PilN domain-containing protein [Patescibacteria group bacterium]